MKTKDKIARMKNFQNEKLIKNISGNDLVNILQRLDDLETRLADYENHTHDYNDEGATVTTTKTTQGVK